MRARHTLLALPVLLLATPALAHPGHEAGGVIAGLTHPLSGLDHMLAMIAVGLWASLRGGKATWAWPATFVAAMLGGYGLGLLSPGAALIEPAILASVIALGALTAANLRMPFAGGLALIALFGAVHGYAHGSEAPATALAGFPVGFALATAGLHLVGLAAGAGLKRLNHPALIRILGAGAALGGLALAVTA